MGKPFAGITINNNIPLPIITMLWRIKPLHKDSSSTNSTATSSHPQLPQTDSQQDLVLTESDTLKHSMKQLPDLQHNPIIEVPPSNLRMVITPADPLLAIQLL